MQQLWGPPTSPAECSFQLEQYNSMGRVARYKRIKAFDPGAKRRPPPPEKGPPKNMAPKHDPDVLPQKMVEIMRLQQAAARRPAPPAPTKAPPQPASQPSAEAPHEFYKVRAVVHPCCT